MAKQSSSVLALSANWQAAFIAVSVLGWASYVANIVYTFVQTGYVSSGTWVFQVTTWLLLPLFVVIGFALLRQYRQVGARFFMAVLAGVIGQGAYQIVSAWENRFWYNYVATQPAGPTDTSWWTAFGNEWVVMVVCLALYSAVLYAVMRKSRG